MHFPVNKEEEGGSGNYAFVWKLCDWLAKEGADKCVERCAGSGIKETCPLTCECIG